MRFGHSKVILDQLETFSIHFDTVCWHWTGESHLNALLSPKRIQSVPVGGHNYRFPAPETGWITSEFAVLNEGVGNIFSGLGFHPNSITIRLRCDNGSRESSLRMQNASWSFFDFCVQMSTDRSKNEIGHRFGSFLWQFQTDLWYLHWRSSAAAHNSVTQPGHFLNGNSL